MKFSETDESRDLLEEDGGDQSEIIKCYWYVCMWYAVHTSHMFDEHDIRPILFTNTMITFYYDDIS